MDSQGQTRPDRLARKPKGSELPAQATPGTACRRQTNTHLFCLNEFSADAGTRVALKEAQFPLDGEAMTRQRAAAPSDPLDLFLAEIRAVPLLTAEEEARLARAWRERGDSRAAHHLITANLRFVVKVAHEYRTYGFRLADLIQEGNIGLMKAVQKYDPDKQIRLISYAVWWIRAYIQNYILRSWSLVKIGTTQAQRKLFFSLARTRHEIERLTPGAALSDEAVDVNLVAKRLKVRPSDVVEMQQRMEGRDLSLDAPVADGTSTHLEFTPADGDGQDEELARLEEDALLSR